MRSLPNLAMLVSGLLLTSLALAAEPASEEPSRIRLYGRVGYSAGGEKIVSGTYVNTGDTYNITAGGGTSGALGVELRATDNIAVLVSVGSQKDKTDATNGELKFARSFKEVIGFYGLTPQWRVGAGVRQDSDAKFTWRHDTAGAGSREFDNANGVVLEAQYFFFPPNTKASHSLQTGVSFRVIQQKFKDKVAGKSYDGNQIGATLFFYY